MSSLTPLKNRSESNELLLYRYLYPRMTFSSEEQQHLVNLEKGYLGEQQFDYLLETKLITNGLLISDLMLRNGGNYFQMDSLLFRQGLFMFEVKNMEGDYYIEDDKWYSSSGHEVANPLIQLQRAQQYLRRFLQQLNVQIPIEAYVIFINPEFTLYNASRNFPIILPTQLPRFMKKLNQSGNVAIKESQRNLMMKLANNHITDPPFSQKPHYTYDEVRKGTVCAICRTISMSTVGDGKYVICSRCAAVEKVDFVIVRSIKEYQFLFPEKLITTNSISDWCGDTVSKKSIRRVLMERYHPQGHGKSFHYVNKDTKQ